MFEIMFEINRFGNKFYKNEQGQFHREDGPAVEYPNGNKFWYINGQYHREDGPAVEYADGDKFWWINGIPYDLEDYHKNMLKRNNNHV